MQSHRKGVITPVRRRRKPVPRALTARQSPPSAPPAPPAPPAPSPGAHRGRKPSSTSSEESSWADTSDTSISSSLSRTSITSSSPSSSSSSSFSSSDGSDDDDTEEEARRRRSASGAEVCVERGRSWSRRGARQRGGSVLCRFCGQRGYGVVKMVLSCCANKADVAWRREFQEKRGTLARSAEACPSSWNLSNLVVAELVTPSPSASHTPPPSPSPRYNWSPCSSDSFSSSSASTLSEEMAGGVSSSAEDADVECSSVRPQLLVCTGHVAVN